jgi:hypothetical protein
LASSRCDAYLDDSNETHERRDRFGGEVTGKETPKEGETFATPRIEGTLPLGIWLRTLERAPEGIELDGEEEVENGAGERDEESDRSSRAEVANDLRTAPARGGKDRPG